MPKARSKAQQRLAVKGKAFKRLPARRSKRKRRSGRRRRR